MIKKTQSGLNFSVQIIDVKLSNHEMTNSSSVWSAELIVGG